MSGILTTTADETAKVGRWLAEEVQDGMGARDGATTVALTGPLGSGKTTFAQGFAEGLGITETLQSPTYVLLKEYVIPGASDADSSLFVHVDVYRLEEPSDLYNQGFREMIDDPARIILIEWAERIRPAIPDDALWVTFEHVTENQRRVVVHAEGEQ